MKSIDHTGAGSRVVRKTLHMGATITVEELKTGDEVILYFKPLERYDWTDPADPEPPLALEEIPTILAGSQMGVVESVMDEGRLVCVIQNGERHDWWVDQLTRVDILASAEETHVDDGYPTEPGWWWARLSENSKWYPTLVWTTVDGAKYWVTPDGCSMDMHTREWGGRCTRQTFEVNGKHMSASDVAAAINRGDLYIGEKAVATPEVPSTHAEILAAIRGPRAPTIDEKVLGFDGSMIEQVTEVIKRYDRPEASFDLMGEGEGYGIKLWSRWLPPVNFFKLVPTADGGVKLIVLLGMMSWDWRLDPHDVPTELDTWLSSSAVQGRIDDYVLLVQSKTDLADSLRDAVPPEKEEDRATAAEVAELLQTGAEVMDAHRSAEDSDTFDLYDVDGEWVWSFCYDRESSSIATTSGDVIPQDSLMRLAVLLGVVEEEDREITRIRIGSQWWSVYLASFTRLVMCRPPDASEFNHSSLEAFVRWALDRTGQPTAPEESETEGEVPRTDTFNLCAADDREWIFHYSPEDNSVATTAGGIIDRCSLHKLAALLGMEGADTKDYVVITIGLKGWHAFRTLPDDFVMWCDVDSRLFDRQSLETFVRWALDRIGWAEVQS